jgi:hypothetical protein
MSKCCQNNICLAFADTIVTQIVGAIVRQPDCFKATNQPLRYLFPCVLFLSHANMLLSKLVVWAFDILGQILCASPRIPQQTGNMNLQLLERYIEEKSIP